MSKFPPAKPGLCRRDILSHGALAVIAAAVGTNAQAATAVAPDPVPGNALRVAFVIDEWVNMIDVAGAWEVFQDTRVEAGRKGARAFYLYAVGPATGQLYRTTGNDGGGLPIQANFAFADAPPPDVIVMGAQHAPDGKEKIEWIKNAAPGARIVMSVCTGAFLLARTGLLNGLSATTHHEYFDSFEEKFPEVKLIRGRRFVDNGKFVTAGGLTSGIDSALHVVSRLVGKEQARATAEYMEYSSDGWETGALVA